MQIQKRLVSSATRLASVSTAHLPRFPPKDALFTNDDVPKPFAPEIWAALQPPPPTALSSFAHRIGLGAVLTDTETIQQSCTHSSFVPFYHHYYPHSPQSKSNAQLAHTGNALLGMFAAEHLQATYPYLPLRALKAAVTAHVGPATCASVAREIGAGPLLRWHRTPTTPTKPAVLHVDALSSVPRSLVALVYQQRSLLSARQFVHSLFLTRQVDLRPLIKFIDPKKALLTTTAKFNRERPRSRLLKETGRFSNSPIFVVGIYSGQDKLGEGFGSSLKMAEFRAAEDSLLRLYLTRRSPEELQLPTSTFPLGLGDVFSEGPEGSYVAPELVASEILYSSSGKSGMTVAGEEGQ